MTGTTLDDIVRHRQAGSWRMLEGIAAAIVEDVDRRTGTAMNPLLGGGTRLMLAFDHRISDDIDLFIRDPQYLGYISPRLNDDVAEQTTAYDEAPDYLKLELPQGEIDFIVRGSLLNLPADTSHATAFRLEPVAEVLAKKLFFRSALLTHRDLFDWWAVETKHPEAIPAEALGALLAPRLAEIESSLNRLEKAGSGHRMWQAIRAPVIPDVEAAVACARGALGRYGEALGPRATRDIGPQT